MSEVAIMLCGYRGDYVPSEPVVVVRPPEPAPRKCKLCPNMIPHTRHGRICSTCYSRRYAAAKANGAPQGGKTRLVVVIGERFGRLTVLEELGLDPNHGRMVLCRCDCGAEVTRRLSILRLSSGQKRDSACKACRRERPFGGERKGAVA